MRFYSPVASLLSRFVRNESGVAATEFAVITPILIVVLVGVASIGTGISSQFSVERKVRRAVEGVIRYGWDDDKIRSFATADGAAAFSTSGSGNAAASAGDGVALTIVRYSVCPKVDEPAEEVPISVTPSCQKPQHWVKILAQKTVSGPFGTSINLRSQADVIAEP